jgi:hypothetical protein
MIQGKLVRSLKGPAATLIEVAVNRSPSSVASCPMWALASLTRSTSVGLSAHSSS